MDSQSLYNWKVAPKKKAADAPLHRESAYTARNRASLIKAAQDVIGDVGLTATIDQLASRAQVSPQTIYNYFESKENLLAEALDEALKNWVLWAHAGETPGVSFQKMIDVCRKLFRVKETHPQFADILKNAFVDPLFVRSAAYASGVSDLQEIAKNEGWELDKIEERAYLWSYSITGIMFGVFVIETLTPEKADASLEISLATMGISKAKAKKLVSHPLVYPESK